MAVGGNNRGSGSRSGNGAAPMRGYIQRWKKRTREFKRGVLIKLFASVIRDSPVLTGRLRANWMFTAGEFPPATDEKDPAGVVTTARVTQGVLAFVDEKDGKYFLTNGLSYVNKIEYEGWSRIKSPQGMVRKNVRRIESILKQQVSAAT